MKHLRTYREQVNLSREALAFASGLSFGTISAIEMRGNDPKLSTAVKIAAALSDAYGRRITVDELVDGKPTGAQ